MESNVTVRIEKHDIIYLNIVKGEFNNANSTAMIPLFWKRYKDDGYAKRVEAKLGVAYTDTMGSEWLYGVGNECELKSDIPAGFERIVIPAQRWAIFTCRDTGIRAISKAYDYAFGAWFVSCGEEILPGYNLERYLEGDMQSESALCELWIPIA